MIKLPKNKFEHGFSIVELVLVLMVVFFLILLITNIPNSLAAITRSKNTSLAKDIANKEMDYLRKQGYDNLNITEEPVTFTDIHLSSLPDSGAVYEIKTCDPLICTNNEAVKEIKIQVSWQESKDTKKVELTTMLSSGGVGQ